MLGNIANVSTNCHLTLTVHTSKQITYPITKVEKKMIIRLLKFTKHLNYSHNSHLVLCTVMVICWLGFWSTEYSTSKCIYDGSFQFLEFGTSIGD